MTSKITAKTKPSQLNIHLTEAAIAQLGSCPTCLPKSESFCYQKRRFNVAHRFIECFFTVKPLNGLGVSISPQSLKLVVFVRRSPSMAKGVGLRLLSRRGSWVQIPPSAPDIHKL